MKCGLCGKERPLVRLEDNDGLSLSLCRECFDVEFSEHDIEWIN